jgi:hypothetical protein
MCHSEAAAEESVRVPVNDALLPLGTNNVKGINQ